MEHIGKGRKLDSVYSMHFVFIISNNCSLSSGHCASFTELITGETLLWYLLMMSKAKNIKG